MTYKGLCFPKCLSQYENNCIVVVTVEIYKQNFIINEVPEKDAPPTKRATERLQRERDDWFHA